MSIIKIFFIFLISLTVSPVFAKSKKDAFIKYTHPRTYVFDLCDSEEQIYLGYNKWSDCFEATIDFTKYVKNNFPQEGDRVKFVYSGYGNRETGFIFAQILCNDKVMFSSGTQTVTENCLRKERFEGEIVFNIYDDVHTSFKLRLFNNKSNYPGQIDQVYLTFKRVAESTNTVKEEAQEQKAIRQNTEIVEVAENFAEEAVEDLAEKAAEEARIAAEAAAALEAARLAEEAAKLEALKLEQEKELLKQQAELEKAIAQVKKNVNHQGKEYLNDYMVSDDPEIQETVEVEEEIISNPDETDGFGRTLLMKAAKAGNDWQINTLLKSGAKVNLKDKDGWTALMYAVRYQESMNCVNLLIEAGADTKIKNNYGSSALMIASCYNNNPEVIKKLASYYSNSDKDIIKSLVLLLSENHTSEYIQLAKLNIFLDKSVPLNTFYEGKTPLMYAAEFGNSTKVIQALLDSNAVTSVRSTEGKTAYEYAVNNKNLKHDSSFWALNKK